MTAPAQAAPFGPRLALGLLGALLAAMMAGLNNRVPSLVLADLQGGLGLGADEASWLSSSYWAGELVAMPFASWFALTLSLRRFHLGMLLSSMLLSALTPLVHDLDLLIVLRALHGLCSGALIPLLMMSALRFLPPGIRLHGLALYAMTSTFAPNIAFWLASLCVDHWQDWRWAFWLVLPLGALAAPLVAWGLPQDTPALARWRSANRLGMLLGVPGLALLALGIDQGVRLDWLHSPVVSAALFAGAGLTGLYLLSEWQHPTPFLRLQLLERRNLGVGFSVFFLLLIVLGSAVSLPALTLSRLHGFRPEQTASLGLLVGLPQLVLGPAVALLLYRKRVDARHVYAAGLVLIALANGLAAGLTAEWQAQQFMASLVLQALGQPMAIVSLLFLSTAVVQMMDGPYVSGIVNTLRSLGSLCGGALAGELISERSRLHLEMLLDTAAAQLHMLLHPWPGLAGAASQQALVLSTADAHRVFGVVTLLLVPIVLRLTRVPAPSSAPASAPVNP